MKSVQYHAEEETGVEQEILWLLNSDNKSEQLSCKMAEKDIYLWSLTQCVLNYNNDLCLSYHSFTVEYSAKTASLYKLSHSLPVKQVTKEAFIKGC